MKISLSNTAALATDADMVAVTVSDQKAAQKKSLAEFEKAFGGKALSRLMEDEGFEGKSGQAVKVATRGKIEARWLLIVGVGKKRRASDIAFTLGRVAAKHASRNETVALMLGSADAEVVRAATEGVICGAYSYETYKTDKKSKNKLNSALLLVGGATKNAALTTAVAHGRAVAENINFARDLVNAPPNDLNPITLAKQASARAKKLGLVCHIWDKKKIAAEKMDLFLAVNKGSAIEPRLIHIAYKPRGATKRVVFVGKGLTFDSGGLCIKPAASMLGMKCDMAGAATTLGIVLAAAQLKLPVELHAVIGSTENMTGDKAYRPGDVYTSHQGKTVEVINTDAEGRMVLADVLSWATKLKPDLMIDHATLTGACMIALGPWTAGLYTDDDDLAKRYEEAGRVEEESFWRMPLTRDLKKTLKSDIADLKHTGNRYGGSITAALFLKEFVGDSNWMHLDIAGPAFLESAHARHPKGGTGFGIATGVRFLEGYAAESKPRAKKTKPTKSRTTKRSPKKSRAK